MMESVEGRCLRCGAPDPGDKPRCICGASLLMDVMLKEPVADERRRFAMARALALLGPPAPAFSQARISLGIPGDPLVRGVSRAFAQKIVTVLSEHGASVVLRPAEPLVTAAAAEPPRRSIGVVLMGILLFVSLAGAAHRFWMSQSAETRNALASALGEPSQAPQGAHGPVGLSTQEISKRAMPSTLSVHCGNHMGSGFFVEEELAVTNAHVACPVGKSMTVFLPDGRRLIGETLKRDEELDLATVRVIGAKAVPLKLGDATRLQPGDPIVFVGSPKGLDFTVHEGKVGFVGREYLGHGYVQFNATVNPGNSGGPLLNGRGEVVGVVSLKIMNAEGLGLALPIEYASKFVSVSMSPEESTRWDELLARVARDEEHEVDQFKTQNDQPVLASVRQVEGVAIFAVLIEHFESTPSRMRHRMVLEAGGESCSMYVDFEHWMPLKEAMDQEKQEDSRRLRWLVSRGITEGVHVGAGRLPIEECTTLPRVGTARLKLDGVSDEELDRFEVPLDAVTAAREEWNRRKSNLQAMEQAVDQQARQQRAEAEERSRGNPEEWRTAFRNARARVSRAEEAKRRVQASWNAGDDTLKRLNEAEAELKAANQKLDDLERLASNNSIPREWRQ